MRALHLAWPAVTLYVVLAVGCGESEPGSDDVGDAGQGTGATAASGSAGKSGGASGGNASGGSAAGTPASGGRPNGDAGGRPDSDAGADHGAGGGGLVDCDPGKIMCRRAPPVCEFGEAPSIDGICYGPCVPIETCACSGPGECPNPNEYTCWMQEHCGPYVQ